MKTAIAYVRVSTDKQQTERQISDIKKYCKDNEIQLIKPFSEIESGLKDDRSELKKMMDYVKSNSVDFVIVSELSRLGRTNEVLNIIKELKKLNICLCSLKENLATLNPDGTENAITGLMINILTGINNFELDTLKYRIKSGLRKAAEKGHWKGGLTPFGFDRKDKMLIINEEEANTVKLIYTKYLEGNGIYLIRDYLNGLNISTKTGKGKWSEKVVHLILTNPIYIGNPILQKVVFENYVPAIIDKETFSKVQSRLKENHRGAKASFNYLLDKGILKCGVCGKSYYARKRKNGKDNRYICLSERYKPKCSNHGIGIQKLEDAVQITLIENFSVILRDLNFNSEETKKIKEDIKICLKDAKRFKSELLKEKLKENKLLDLLLNNTITENKYKEKQSEIDKTKISYQRIIDSLNAQIQDLQQRMQQVESLPLFIKQAQKTGLSKEIIRNIVTSIIIEPSEKSVKLSDVKNDVVLKISLNVVNNQKIQFYISQRSNNIQYIVKAIKYKYDGDSKTLRLIEKVDNEELLKASEELNKQINEENNE